MENSDTNLYENDIQLYSRKFIIVYGTIFTVFLASFLSSSNLKNMDRKRTLVIIFGILYSLGLLFFGIYLSTLDDLNPTLSYFILPLIFNFIYMMLQDKIVLEPVTPEDFIKKGIVKPIVIGIAIQVISTIVSVIAILYFIIGNAARM